MKLESDHHNVMFKKHEWCKNFDAASEIYGVEPGSRFIIVHHTGDYPTLIQHR